MRHPCRLAATGLLCAGLALLAVNPQPATADDDAAENAGDDDAAEDADDDFGWDRDDAHHYENERRADVEAGRSEAVEPSPVVETPSTDLVWTGLPRLGADDGEFCIDRQWVQLAPDEVEEAETQAWDDIRTVMADPTAVGPAHPDQDCPTDDVDELPAQMLQQVVRDQIVDMLPRPEPSVPPGEALTGMPAYLVTGHELTYGPVEHAVDLDIMDVDVHVTAEATTTVDWGDGSPPQTYHQPGLPYPDGQVVHTYAETGEVPIEIVDTWTMTYEVYRDGAHVITDTLTFDLAPVTIDELEVKQFQSVRTTPD